MQLSKILRAKREKIGALRDMNAQAEKQRSYSQELNVDFQRRYAALVLDIEKLNRDLNQHLVVVQQFCQEVSQPLRFCYFIWIKKYFLVCVWREKLCTLFKITNFLNTLLYNMTWFQIAPEQGLPGPTLLPGQIRERCYEEAATIVDVTNHSSGSPQVNSPAILDLITKLTSLMLQMKVC